MKTSLMVLVAAMTVTGAAFANEGIKGTSEPQKVESAAMKKEAKVKHATAKASTKKEEKKNN